jgi:hypothetical protein
MSVDEHPAERVDRALDPEIHEVSEFRYVEVSE